MALAAAIRLVQTAPSPRPGRARAAPQAIRAKLDRRYADEAEAGSELAEEVRVFVKRRAELGDKNLCPASHGSPGVVKIRKPGTGYLVTDDDGTQLYTYDLGFENISSSKATAAFKASGLTERPRFRTPGLARAAYDRVARGRGLIPGAPTSQPGR